MMGGVCVNTGTIPSKTLREAVLYLTGFAQRDMYGASYRVKSEITIADLLARTQHVVGREVEVIRAQLLRNHVDILGGTARFVDAAHRRSSTASTAATTTRVTAEQHRHRHRHQAGPAVARSSSTTSTCSTPTACCGSSRCPTRWSSSAPGVIGIEYASMFAALGTRVTVVEKRPAMLEFCDPEVVESLKFHLRDQAVTFRFGEEVAKVEITPRGTVTSLASGKRIAADMVMYSAGRQGVTDELDLEKAGLRPTTAAGSRSTSSTAPTVAAHLRRRRRDRLPGAGRDEHGPGPARGLPRVRRAGARAARACSRSGSTRSPRSPTAG